MKTRSNGTAKAQRTHTTHTATDRRKRGQDSVVIQITTTRNLCEVVDQVVKTGFFGNSRAAAAERLLAEAVRGLLKEGTIQKRQKAFETDK